MSGSARKRKRASSRGKNTSAGTETDDLLNTRLMHQRVRTAKGRKSSSTRWLQRQLNDPYVVAARRHGYRSRAAFKLLELDDRFHFLKPGTTVLDLGAAPGSWTQVALERMGGDANHPQSASLVAVDILAMDELPGVQMLQLDIEAPEAVDVLQNLFPEGVDVVLSDMAPNATGHRRTDHLRIMALVEAAADAAVALLNPGGWFVAKVWQGGAEHGLLKELKRNFTKVRHVKPAASRSDSAEIYVVAEGHRLSPETNDQSD